MFHLLGFVLAALFAALWITNGFLMLVFPRAWFRWSRWLGVQGAMTEHWYGRSDRGVFQVRLLGLVFLAVIAWVLFDLLSRSGR
jgi:hypothetical protein